MAEIKRRGKGKGRTAPSSTTSQGSSGSPKKGGATLLENGHDDAGRSTTSGRKGSSRSPANWEGRRGGKGRKLDVEELEEEGGREAGETRRPRLAAAALEEDVDMEEGENEVKLENAEEEGGSLDGGWMGEECPRGGRRI